MIERNKIKFCTCVGIKVAPGVNSGIFDNELKTNSIGIIITDSKSKIIKNKIEKSSDNGIKIICSGKGKICNPDVEK